MFGLARLKQTTAKALGSEPLRAEVGMTFLDGALSAGVLAALALNASLGWWWADPIAALVVAAAAVGVGIGHWRDAAPHVETIGPSHGGRQRRRSKEPVRAAHRIGD